MTPEKFDIKKFLKAPLQPVYWAKTTSYGSGLLVVALIALTVYRAYIKKPPDTNKIVAKQGSVVNIIEKSKRMFIPFVEGYIDQPSNEHFNTGIRAGLRFEF